MEYIEFLIRLSVCIVLGILIGLERQWRHRMIGLRTNVLVCLGAFLFVTTAAQTNEDEIIRMAAQVISGIGFLGAGVILRDGINIKGLNTAATLWCAAAIGVLTATGLLIEAAIGTIFILFANIFLRLYAKKMINKNNIQMQENYLIKIVCKEEKEVIVKTLLTQKLNKENVSLNNLESINIDNDKIKIYANIIVPMNYKQLIEKTTSRIGIEPGVSSVNWKLQELIKETEDDDA
jgi:putative Mg2+ transporter-C (MgtC) family protein